MGGAKGIIWGIVFMLTAVILITIPTKLIFTYWIWLNEIVDPIELKPVYTFALLAVFGWIVSIIVFLIFIAATCRAFIQRNAEDMGIPKGVKGFGLVTTLIIITFMVIWYLLTNQIAFFSWTAP